MIMCEHTSWWQAAVCGEQLWLDLTGILTPSQVSPYQVLLKSSVRNPKECWHFATLQLLSSLGRPENTKINI